jgi:Protein of unknown function (DUF3515)
VSISRRLSSLIPTLPLRPSLRRVPAALCLLAVAGCASGTAADAVAVPRPPGAAVGPCRALHAALPEKVDGLRRHSTSPASQFTAAWGSPAIVLRCGVPTPDVLTPGNAHYNPTADDAEIDGVDWLPQRLSDGGVRCTTTLRKAFVEVTIPAEYAGQDGDLGSLTDLAHAVGSTVPTGL